MSFLSLGGEPFTVGWAHYSDVSPTSSNDVGKIWIWVRHAEHSGMSPFLAEVDTGAPWTLLNSELLDAFGLLDAEGESATTRTALGPISGPLVRTTLVLESHAGREVLVDATVLASKDWTGPNLLGMIGFLERIRFAVDPFEQKFHFGTQESS